MSTTRIQRFIKAPRDQVYRALLDANAISIWMVTAGKGKETPPPRER